MSDEAAQAAAQTCREAKQQLEKKQAEERKEAEKKNKKKENYMKWLIKRTYEFQPLKVNQVRVEEHEARVDKDVKKRMNAFKEGIAFQAEMASRSNERGGSSG